MTDSNTGCRRSASPPPPSTQRQREKAGPAGRLRWRRRLYAELQANASIYIPLWSNPSPEFEGLLYTYIADFLRQYPNELPPALTGNYVSWARGAVRCSTSSELPPEFLAALTDRRHQAEGVRKLRRETGAMLFKPVQAWADFKQTASIVTITLLPIPYPPVGHHVAEDADIYSTWVTWQKNYELPDSRKPRYPVHLLDRSKLAYTVPAELNCVLVDKDTGELAAVVIRNLCGNLELLRWAKVVITAAVIARKSIRLEDPGEIVIGGFSAGALSSPQFGFAKNLLRKTDPEDAAKDQTDIATLMTIFWLLAAGSMPREVIQDLRSYYNLHNIPRLDPNWPYVEEGVTGALQLPMALGSFLFEDVELAPGSAVLVQRYARAVHNENQGHKYAIAWTTYKGGTDVRGGNFFLASYGILILLAQDTAFAWQPAFYHTTSLGAYDPTFDVTELEEPTYNQQGVAFVTSSRLASMFAKWKALNISGKEKIAGFEREMLAGGSDADFNFKV
ncbi:hypothetical protein DFP72DRAFT_824582 [Ephemerocybe angulata]|uniref:Uncharacterized protein n=1 Tax=Ephemerocybe angulata TaxID=980116 RepID=A0A8H6HF85_9AGAR|nr:hypothetical protein DFP72DRAFT_824582 [Tulosesus angulatus]